MTQVPRRDRTEIDPALVITPARYKRIKKNIEKFNRLIQRGKTPQQIFQDMLKVIGIEEDDTKSQREQLGNT